MIDISLGSGVLFALGGLFGFFLLWLLNRGKDHDCIFEYPQKEIHKNLMTFLEAPKGFPDVRYVCPECGTELVLRKGVVAVPETMSYRSCESWVCPKHNWGWERKQS